MMASSEEVTSADWTFVNRNPINKSAENGTSSGETNTASTSSETTAVGIQGGNNKETRRAMLKKNKEVHWRQTRRILLGLLAHFVIAKGRESETLLLRL